MNWKMAMHAIGPHAMAIRYCRDFEPGILYAEYHYPEGMDELPREIQQEIYRISSEFDASASASIAFAHKVYHGHLLVRDQICYGERVYLESVSA